MRDTTVSSARCTAQSRDGSFCDGASILGAPFPICPGHAARLYPFLRDRVDSSLHETGSILQSIPMQVGGRRSAAGRDVVYYILIGDYIKIGSSRNINHRLANYPPGSRLLAMESGHVEVEKERHLAFAAYRSARREWYHPGVELVAHIRSLRGEDVQDRAF